MKLSGIKTYIYSIARNSAIDMYRKNVSRYKNVNRYTEAELDEMIIDVNVDVENEVYRRINENVIHDTLIEMEEPDRSIFILRYIYSLKLKEIADKLKMNEDAVESRIRRGLRKLGKELSKKGIIVVAFLCMILPVSVYGVIKIKQFYFDRIQLTDYSNKISVNKLGNNEDEYYKLEIDLPEEYTYSQILDKYYCGNRITGNIIDLKLYRADKDKDWLENQVVNCEELSVAGHSAFLFEKKSYDLDNSVIDGEYKLYLFFDDEGYVACVTGSAEIDKEVFIGYCNTITLRKCHETEATKVYCLSQSMLSTGEFISEIDKMNNEACRIYGEIIEQSEWKEFGNENGKIELMINSIDVLDSIEGLNRDNFFNIYRDCFDYNVFDEVISESGKFTNVSRLHIPKSDGINTIVKADRKDIVQEKLVFVTLELNCESLDFSAPEIIYLKSSDGNYNMIDDRYYYYDNIGMLKHHGLPVYSDTEINEVGEYARDVRWNIEGDKKISVGYLVDEDLLCEAYLCFRDENGNIKYLHKVIKGKNL